jgi:hypothetical protein
MTERVWRSHTRTNNLPHLVQLCLHLSNNLILFFRLPLSLTHLLLKISSLQMKVKFLHFQLPHSNL